jgi:hypothetical protein
MSNDKNVVPRFKTITRKNEAKSKEAGRPIFDEIEVVEVRIAGNRDYGVFPVHARWAWITNPHTGDQEEQTYAQRWPDQYRRFKENQTQIAEGTPIDELPFLSAGKRAELKALSIYTAEALASLDGQNLKNLGQGGRELKNQAQAYLDNAKGSANTVRMAAEIEELKQALRDMQAERAGQTAAPATASPFQEWEPDQIKDWIEHNTGERPKGNPNHATLVRRADEIASERNKVAA